MSVRLVGRLDRLGRQWWSWAGGWAGRPPRVGQGHPRPARLAWREVWLCPLFFFLLLPLSSFLSLAFRPRGRTSVLPTVPSPQPGRRWSGSPRPGLSWSESGRPALDRVTPAGAGQGHLDLVWSGWSESGLSPVGRSWTGSPFGPCGRWVCRKRLAGPAWPALIVRGQGDTSRAVDRRINQASHRRLDTVGRSRTGSPPGYLWRFDRPWEAPMAGREGQGRRPVHRESVGWGWTADQRPQGPSTSETG